MNTNIRGVFRKLFKFVKLYHKSDKNTILFSVCGNLATVHLRAVMVF